MKRLALLLITGALLGAESADPDRAANTVILDEHGVKNLGIETVEVEETDFEETAFALGRIEAIPTNRTVASSRIPGRIIDLNAAVGDMVEKGAVLATIESRQPGDPPPRVPLTALSSGLVTKSDARLGEPVEPDKALMEITDFTDVFAVARVPEHIAGKLNPGALARIRVAARPEETFEGGLLRFGTSADKLSGTIDAIFRLSNPDLTLRPDMRAEFSIILSKREGVNAVPHEAVQGDAGGRFVYIADYELENAFVRTPVVLGAQNDRYVEVKEGLLPGDEVVTRGAYPLAFAGKGSVSLKEALDAAHGHPHNEDGTEMTREQAESAAGGNSHSHEHGKASPLVTFLLVTNVLLLILLVSSTVLHRKRATA